MRVVVALGDEALFPYGAGAISESGKAYVARVAAAISALRRAGHDVVATHGHGPHVGMFALQAASTPDRPFPLDALETEGEAMIGDLVEQEMMSGSLSSGVVVALLTRALVNRADPSFLQPREPIGAFYDETEARILAAERGWRIARDGPHWRRVVASPKPLSILEAPAIDILLRNGVTVICAGVVPVIRREDGSLLGVEGAVDKELASALLAAQLDAQWLVIPSNVEAVYESRNASEPRRISRTTPVELAAMWISGGPAPSKIAAACKFVSETGGRAGIGRLEDLEHILAGDAGTTVAALRS